MYISQWEIILQIYFKEINDMEMMMTGLKNIYADNVMYRKTRQ